MTDSELTLHFDKGCQLKENGENVSDWTTELLVCLGSIPDLKERLYADPVAAPAALPADAAAAARTKYAADLQLLKTQLAQNYQAISIISRSLSLDLTAGLSTVM